MFSATGTDMSTAFPNILLIRSFPALVVLCTVVFCASPSFADSVYPHIDTSSNNACSRIETGGGGEWLLQELVSIKDEMQPGRLLFIPYIFCSIRSTGLGFWAQLILQVVFIRVTSDPLSNLDQFRGLFQLGQHSLNCRTGLTGHVHNLVDGHGRVLS